MSVLDETPQNTNFLSPLHFHFMVKKLPTVEFFVQNVNLPGLSLPPPEPSNPFVKVPYGGDHIQYDDIMINYKVDENLTNYLEIHNWIRGMGFPQAYTEYAELNAQPLYTGNGRFSDISLIIYNSNRIPNYNIIFHDAFPISISSLIFDVTQGDPQYLEASATFKYTYYDIETIQPDSYQGR